jgi:hypothetical protein
MAVDADRLPKLLHGLDAGEHSSEVAVLATCNRTEVYLIAERFHGTYDEVRDFFADLTYLPPEHFADNLYVHYDEAAVRHLFEVVAGLDSSVPGGAAFNAAGTVQKIVVGVAAQSVTGTATSPQPIRVVVRGPVSYTAKVDAGGAGVGVAVGDPLILDLAGGAGLAHHEGQFRGDDPGLIAVNLSLKTDLGQVGGGRGSGGNEGTQAGEAEIGGNFLGIARGDIEHEQGLAGGEAGEASERRLVNEGGKQGAKLDTSGGGRAGFLGGGEAEIQHVQAGNEPAQGGQLGLETSGTDGGAQALHADGIKSHQRSGSRAVAHTGQHQRRGGGERHPLADRPQTPGPGDRAAEGKLWREESEPRGGQAMQADFNEFIGWTHGSELAGGGGEGESLAGGDAQHGVGAGGRIELKGPHPSLGGVGIEIEAAIELHRTERGQAKLVEGIDHELERAGEAHAGGGADGELALAGKADDGQNRQGREGGEIGIGHGDLPPAGKIGRAGSPTSVELEQVFVGRDQARTPSLTGAIAGEREVGAQVGGVAERAARGLRIESRREGGELTGVVKRGLEAQSGREVAGRFGLAVDF